MVFGPVIVFKVERQFFYQLILVQSKDDPFGMTLIWWTLRVPGVTIWKIQVGAQ